MYLNGALAATLGLAITTTTGGTGTRLGRQFDPFGEYFHGELRDVRIYSGALTSGEIAALAAPEPSTVLLTALGLCLVLGGARSEKA